MHLDFLAASTRQQGRHAGAEQALRCLGLLLDGIRLPGIAACSLGLRRPRMAASIFVGLGNVLQPRPRQLAPIRDKERLPGATFNVPKAMLGPSVVQHLIYHRAK